MQLLRPARWLFAIGATGLLLLAALNIQNLIDEPGSWQAVRADLRMAFGVLTIVGACWIVTDQRARREARRWDSLASVVARMDETTLGIPRMRIVGTAIVDRTDELPGYAKGYVDGLTRKPMETTGNVFPIEGAKN